MFVFGEIKWLRCGSCFPPCRPKDDPKDTREGVVVGSNGSAEGGGDAAALLLGNRGSGDCVGGQKGVVAAVAHFFGWTLHDWLGVLMETSHHGVGMPSTQELHGIAVDVSTEQRHGSSGPEGASADVFGGDTGDGLEDRRSQSQCGGDCCGCNLVTLVVTVVSGALDGTIEGDVFRSEIASVF